MGHSIRKPSVSTLASMDSGVHRRAFRRGALAVYPHPALDAESFEVNPSDPEVIEVTAALIGTMRATPDCWSISAPQLGHHMRLLCLDVTGHPDARSCAGLVVLANPEILSMSGSILMREECISFPDLEAEVVRASDVVVTGMVPGTGRTVVIMADGFEARCLLHELDHLDGITMIDRVEPCGCGGDDVDDGWPD